MQYQNSNPWYTISDISYSCASFFNNAEQNTLLVEIQVTVLTTKDPFVPWPILNDSLISKWSFEFNVLNVVFSVDEIV